MKTLSWKWFGLLFVMFVAISTFAQTDATATSQIGDQNPLAKNPSETTRVVTERGAHYRVWADIVNITNRFGESITRTN